uniref:Polyprotein n=1 Tax=Areca palm necrotic ringspot virus 2 TaxID=3367521 RepID=A0AB74UNY9_9POTY
MASASKKIKVNSKSWLSDYKLNEVFTDLGGHDIKNHDYQAMYFPVQLNENMRASGNRTREAIKAEFKEEMTKYSRQSMISSPMVKNLGNNEAVEFSCIVERKIEPDYINYNPRSDTCIRELSCVKSQIARKGHLYVCMEDYIFTGIQGTNTIPVWQGEVFKDGYCWANILLAWSFHLSDFDDIRFAKRVEGLKRDVMAYPALFDLVVKLINITYDMPMLWLVQIPSLWINHTHRLVHVLDQRGAPRGMHQLEVEAFKDLFYVTSLGDRSEAKSWKVGSTGTNQEQIETQVLFDRPTSHDVVDRITEDLLRKISILIEGKLSSALEIQTMIHKKISLMDMYMIKHEQVQICNELKQAVAMWIKSAYVNEEELAKEGFGTLRNIPTRGKKINWKNIPHYLQMPEEVIRMDLNDLMKPFESFAIQPVGKLATQATSASQCLRRVNDAYGPACSTGQVSIPLVRGFVPKEGFCYMTAFLALGQQVIFNDCKRYTDQVEKLHYILGSWPTFKQVYKALYTILVQFPYLDTAAIPTLVLNRENQVIHFCDQRGQPNNTTVLLVDTLGDIIDLINNSNEEWFTYKVGATMQNEIDYVNAENSDISCLSIDQEKTWQEIFKEEIGREEAEKRAVMWRILKSHYEQDVLDTLPVRKAPVPISPHISTFNMMKFYQENLEKVRKNWRKWFREGTLIEDLAKDAELALFVLMSPATMAKLIRAIQSSQTKFDNITAIFTNDANAVHMCHLLKCMIKGMGNTLNERLVSLAHLKARELIDNSALGTTQLDLMKKLAKEHANFCDQNFFIVTSLERSLHEKNIKQFLGISSTVEWCSFVVHMAWPDINGGYGKGRWSGGQGSTGERIKRTADKIFEKGKIGARTKKLYTSFISTILIILHICSYVWGMCSILQLSIFLGRVAIRRFVKVPNQTTMFMFLMASIGLLIYVNREMFRSWREKKEFQSKKNEPPKVLMSCMAFAILITYIFNVDMANMLASAFQHFSRLASALLDANLITGSKEFQADFLNVELEITEQEASEGIVQRVKDTYGAWRLAKNLEGIDNTRPLEYGAEYGNQYVIHGSSAVEVAAQALNTTKDWNFVLGATGSGKSTIFPVAYYNLLKQQTKRKHRILILQPTRAATRNVAGGIESHFGQAIYVKHQDFLQQGHLGIQVMTYGTALYTHMANEQFLDQFDTIFLDESHLISEHSLVLESVLNIKTNIVKFYVTATPRVAKVKIEPSRRFPIQKFCFDGKDPQAWIRNIGTGTMEDPLVHGKTSLIFVAGKKESETLAATVNSKYNNIVAYAVHSDNFKKVINRVEEDLNMKPKNIMVFCTNIFETGVTMDVDVVVDFGFTMRPTLDLTEKTLLLEKKRITINQREQRIGRCGRLKKGTALCFGKVTPNDQSVDACTVYSAAILSYVLDVDIYVNSHLSTYWLENITKDQATLMAALQLPLFMTRDLIDKEGRIHKNMAKFLTKYANESLTVNIHEHCISSELYASWPRLEEVAIRAYRGEIPDEVQVMVKERIPFACQNVDMELYMELVKALKGIKPSAQRLFKNRGEITRRITLDIREPALQQTLSYIQEMITIYTNALTNYSELERKLNFGLFASKLNCIQAKTSVKRQIEKVQRNLDKVTRLRSRVEDLLAVKESEVECDYYDNIDIKRCLEFQSGQELSKDKFIELCELESVETASVSRALLEGDLKTAAWGLFCIFIAILGYIVYQCVKRAPRIGNIFEKLVTNSDSEDKEMNFEGKGKKRPSARDKRNPTMMYSQECEDVLDTYFGDDPEAKLKVRGKKKYDNAYIQHLTKDKLPWYIFYDISNDDMVDYAILKNEVGKELFRTKTPIADQEKATIATEEDLTAPLAHALWADECNDYYYEIKMKNGRTYKVHMTPHNPSKYTGHGNVAGFPEKNNILRQTGKTKILECASEVPHSKANPDTPNMIALIYNKGEATHILHAIIYNHWLIIPGHIMVNPGSCYKLNYQGNWFDFDIKQVVHVPGMDMILVPKPPSLKLVKVVAHARELTQPEEITFFYYSKQMKKFVQSGSRRALSDKSPGKWSHNISTAKGMCGAPVISMNTGHLVGIHVVGDHITKLNTFQTFGNEILSVLNTQSSDFLKPRILATPNDLGFKNEDFVNFQMRKISYLKDVYGPIAESEFEANISSGEAEEVITVRVEDNWKTSFEAWSLRDGRVEEKKPLQSDTFKGGFSRDTSMYTQENFQSWAKGNMHLVTKEIKEKNSFHPTLEMDIVAEMVPKVLEKHRKLCESDHWLEFKELHPELTENLQELEWQYLPSKLNKSAYWMDLMKYDHPERATPNFVVLKEAAIWVVNHLIKNGMKETRICTTEQVLEDLQWQTAAGAVYYGAKGKVLENYNSDQIRSLAEWCRDNLLKGKNAGIWNASLKAELRPKEKIEANKTRVFTAAPLTTLMATKFYVDDFNKQFYQSHLKANHTVGINKFRRGWEQLYGKLNREGYYWGGGDGSRYDSSIEPFFFDMMVWIRMQFVVEEEKEEFQKALWNMYREFVYTPIYCLDGNVVIKRLGQPSGQPSTVVDNTIILMVSFVYAILEKFGLEDGKNILDKELFCFVCNGDDNKFTVSKTLVQDGKFDLSKQFKNLGLDYKFEELTKDPLEHFYMSLQFTKTTEGIGFALDEERLVAILQWKRGKKYMDVLQSIQAACVESYNRVNIFKVACTYLRWFLYQYHRELAYEEMEEGGKLRILTETEIHNLHYQPEFIVKGIEEQNLNQKEFQMDVGGERSLMTSGDQAAYAEQQIGPVTRTPPGGNIVTPVSSGEATSWNLGTLSTESIELAMIPNIDGTPVLDESTLKAIPYSEMHFDNTTATGEQVKAWESYCKQKYGGSGQPLSDSHFNKLKVAFIYWCADNGTSENHDFDARTKVPTGPNTSMELPLRPFLEGSKSVGLRKIMRFYSDLTVLLLKKRGTLTRWAIKRGIRQKEMIPFAFDFLKFDHKITSVVREILTQAKAGALGSGIKRAMLTDGSVSTGTSYERHTTRDVSEYEHGPSGTNHAMIM